MKKKNLHKQANGFNELTLCYVNQEDLFIIICFHIQWKIL